MMIEVTKPALFTTAVAIAPLPPPPEIVTSGGVALV